jgi:hypothetical protein
MSTAFTISRSHWVPNLCSHILSKWDFWTILVKWRNLAVFSLAMSKLVIFFKKNLYFEISGTILPPPPDDQNVTNELKWSKLLENMHVVRLKSDWRSKIPYICMYRSFSEMTQIFDIFQLFEISQTLTCVRCRVRPLITWIIGCFLICFNWNIRCHTLKNHFSCIWDV